MESIYRHLQRKFNTMGLGMPETEAGYELEYLAELFTKEEAEFALKMEKGLQTAEEVAASMEISVEDARAQLESMAKRSNIFRIHEGDVTKYTLVPIIHGFLEFNIDRFNDTIAKNFGKHYMKGMGARFYGSTEPLFRVLPVNRDSVENDECMEIDDMEAIIRRQDKIALTPCFCRTSTQSSPKATGCNFNPDFSELCMAFGIFADFYVENGNARYITVDEALEHMRRCDDNGNVIEVLNTKNIEVMCSCCDCCCGVMKALLMFGGPSAGVVSNYKTEYDESTCIKCGKCGERCFMGGVTFEDGEVKPNKEKCVGCGLCVTTCPTKSLKLFRKPEEEIYTPPTDSVIELYDYVGDLRRKTHEI